MREVMRKVIREAVREAIREAIREVIREAIREGIVSIWAACFAHSNVFCSSANAVVASCDLVCSRSAEVAARLFFVFWSNSKVCEGGRRTT